MQYFQFIFFLTLTVFEFVPISYRTCDKIMSLLAYPHLSTVSTSRAFSFHIMKNEHLNSAMKTIPKGALTPVRADHPNRTGCAERDKHDCTQPKARRRSAVSALINKSLTAYRLQKSTFSTIISHPSDQQLLKPPCRRVGAVYILRNVTAKVKLLTRDGRDDASTATAVSTSAFAAQGSSAKRRQKTAHDGEQVSRIAINQCVRAQEAGGVAGWPSLATDDVSTTSMECPSVQS